MASIVDLLKNYNSEFIERLTGYATEDFSEFTAELTKMWGEILEDKLETQIALAEDLEAKARIALTKAYQGFFKDCKEEVKLHNNWKEAFSSRYKARETLLEALNPIIEGHKNLAENIKEGPTDKKKNTEDLPQHMKKLLQRWPIYIFH